MVEQTPGVSDVLEYLRTTGWQITGHWRDAQVWTRNDFDVLVPPGDQLSDTPMRLRELAHCVADAEGRSANAVWRDLLGVRRDSMSYSAAFPADSVPFAAGLRALQALRVLLVVSARTAAGPDEIRPLLDRMLLSPGVDGTGVEVALPLTGGEPDPLGRRVARRLRDSCAAALPATTQADDTELTPTVCLALADLAGPDLATPFTLAFRWSGEPSIPNDTIRFPAGSGERLRATGRRIRARGMPLHGVVEGAITRLSDDATGPRHQITVRGVLIVGGVLVGRRRVTVQLQDAADYRTALTAHRDGRRVRARGAAGGDSRGRRILTVYPGGLHLIDPTPHVENGS